jgi:hypothetical protein
VRAPGAKALVEAARPRGPLRALALKGNRLGDAGLNALASGIEGGAAFDELDLRCVRSLCHSRALAEKCARGCVRSAR